MIPAWNPAGGKRKQPEGSRAIRLHQRKCCSGCFPFYMSETNPIRTRILTASKDIDCNECQVVCAALANHLAPNGVELWGGFGQAEELGIQVSAFQWPTGVVLENSNLVVDQIFVQNDLLIRRELKVSSVNTSNPRLHEGQGECWKVHGCPPQIAVQWDPDPGAFDDCWYAGEHGISGVSMPNSNL